MQLPIERMTKMGMLVCVGLILSYVEVLVPFVPTILGIKVGLANALVVMILYAYGVGYSMIFQFCRILLMGLLFGNVFSFVYSIAGAVISLGVMFGLKKIRFFDIPTVSLFGAISHNIAQLVVAYFFVQSSAVFYYGPILLLCGSVFGYVIGWLAELLLKRRLL